MVAAAPNRAEVEGTVQAVQPHPTAADHLLVVVEVAAVRDVPGEANQVSAVPGESLEIGMRRPVADAAGVAPGVRLRCLVRRAGPTAIYALPDSVQAPS